MTDIDPLSRTGLIAGMALALLLGAANKNYETYTEPIRVDAGRKGLGLVATGPEHPAIGEIERFICAYGSDYCSTEFTDRVYWWSSIYGVSPYLITAIGVHESSLNYNAGRLCTFGYTSCRVRFISIDDEIGRVVKTFSRYGRGEIQSLSIWHTGSVNDRTGYPERVSETARRIEGF